MNQVITLSSLPRSVSVPLDEKGLAAAIREHDSSGMKARLESFPAQLSSVVSLEGKPARKSFDGVIFCGMGGSAMAGDLARDLLGSLVGRPVATVRDYRLPPWPGRDTLAVLLSYSGNTEETVSAARECLERGISCVAVTSGGELARLAGEKGIPMARIAPGYPPRTALGSLFAGIVAQLAAAGLVTGSRDLLENLAGAAAGTLAECRPDIPADRNPARLVAGALKETLPVFYGCRDLGSVAFRWKTQLAENSKHLSFVGELPEMNHNEVVGWVFPAGLVKGMVPVFLRDPSQDERVARRFEVTEELLEPRRFSCRVSAAGPTLASRVVSLIVFGDWLSYYLALENGVDPTPVERISYLKQALSRSGG